MNDEFGETYYESFSWNNSLELNQENSDYFPFYFISQKNNIPDSSEQAKDDKIDDAIKNIFSNKKDLIHDPNDNMNNYIEDRKRYFLTIVSDTQKTKKHYFKIIKARDRNKDYKKLGRRKKTSSHKKTPNDRKRPDNIINKILNRFINSTLSYFNSKLSKYNNKKKLLQKIWPISKKYSKAENKKKLLLKTIGEILAERVSDRSTKYEKDFNKKIIDEIRKNKKALEINSMLDKTVKQMYELYESNTIPEYNLNNDLKLDETNDENYISLLKDKASDFINIINNINGRNKGI